MGGISIWQLAIVVVIFAVLFGGNKLRNLGSDLGTSIKGFKKAMKDEPANLEHKDESNDANFKDTVAEHATERTEEKDKV